MHVDPSLAAKLREVLSRGPPLRFAVLFGSRATGRARSSSDVDVAILPADADLPLQAELELASTLSEAAGLEVDLVRLDQDDPLLQREIALQGICLFEDAPGSFAAYRADAVSRWIDFDEMVAPHRERFLRRLAGTQT